jgi:hypothetical protein
MTEKQYEREVIKPNKDIISFYFKMEDKYGKRAIRPQPVPKFR